MDIHAAALLKALGVTMQSGSITLHFDQGRVQKVETTVVHRPGKGSDTLEQAFRVAKGLDTGRDMRAE